MDTTATPTPTRPSLTRLIRLIRSNSMWRAALAGLYLPGAFVVVFIVLSVINNLRGNSNDLPNSIMLVIAVLIFMVASALWAWSLVRPLTLSQTQRNSAVIVGGIAAALMTTLSILGLGQLEVYFVEEGHAPLPLHQLYTLLFVPTAFLAAAITSGAIGKALGDWPFATRLALRCGIAAGLAYLVLNIVQDVLGRRVGGPNAGETATMITVTLVCHIGASMATSAALGAALKHRYTDQL